MKKLFKKDNKVTTTTEREKIENLINKSANTKIIYSTKDFIQINSKKTKIKVIEFDEKNNIKTYY